MPPRTRGRIMADLQVIKSAMANTIGRPVDDLPARTIEWMIEWIDQNYDKLQQMSDEAEFTEDDLPEVSRIQGEMIAIKFNCTRKLGEIPATPIMTTPAPSRYSNLKREEIPFFDGNPLEWPQFWTVFKDLVWDNPTISNPKEKLRRLYSNVALDVRRLLPNLDNSTPDLNAIAEDLQEEFGDSIKVQYAFLKGIHEVPMLKNNNDVQGWLQIEKMAKQLKCHYPAVDAEHVKALQHLATKLPRWESFNFREQKEFNADKLIEICRCKLRANERDLSSSTQEQVTDTNSNRRNQPWNRDQQNRVNVATTAPSERCTFCAGPHSTPDCRLSLAARRDIIQQRRGCYICFERYFPNHDCQQIETCHSCRRRHSPFVGCGTAITPRQQRLARNETPRYERTTEIQTPRLSNETRTESNDERAASESTTSHNTNVTQSRSGPHRYSPIVRVQVEYEDRTRQVRALLDGCSDISYVAKSCVEHLKAPVIDNGVTQTASFNNEIKTHRDQHTDLKVRSIINRNHVLASFHVVDQISKGDYRTPSAGIQRWMAQRGFVITDSDDSEAPEMLIGNDILEDYVLTGQRARIAPKLWAKETKYGWCIVGEEMPSSERYRTNIHTCNLVSSCVGRDQQTILEADNLFELEKNDDWVSDHINSIRFDSNPEAEELCPSREEFTDNDVTELNSKNDLQIEPAMMEIVSCSDSCHDPIERGIPISTVRQMRLRNMNQTICEVKRQDELRSRIFDLEIPNGEMATDWGYVSTYDNSADIGTRPIQWKTLVKQDLWWQSPLMHRLKRNWNTVWNQPLWPLTISSFYAHRREFRSPSGAPEDVWRTE